MRSILWGWIKALLFRLDAERAHRLTVFLIRLGNLLGGVPLRIAAGAVALPERKPEVFGLEFRSRLGLAAGFDKDAEILTALPRLGFGFAEIGTVTPRPQEGNPRPRLFRDPARQAIFNRMGFNGQGAVVVSKRLARARAHLPETFRVGVNIGKNKDTSAENAASDYVAAIREFKGLADYVVINVSSPNTPGLRALQTVEALKPIAGGVLEEVASWAGKMPPVLLKLAPELFSDAGADEVQRILSEGEAWGIRGWVLTNTLGGKHRELPGGWSGALVRDASRSALAMARKMTTLPIISVGGIMSPEDAVERLSSGAQLVQIYSGWIYGGPDFPGKIARKIQNT